MGCPKFTFFIFVCEFWKLFESVCHNLVIHHPPIPLNRLAVAVIVPDIPHVFIRLIRRGRGLLGVAAKTAQSAHGPLHRGGWGQLDKDPAGKNHHRDIVKRHPHQQVDGRHPIEECKDRQRHFEQAGNLRVSHQLPSYGHIA